MIKTNILSLIAVALLSAATASAASRADVNSDGSVNAGDVSTLYAALLGGSSDTLYDVNNDGSVNAGDVSAIYNVILNGEQEERPEYIVGGDISLLPQYLAKGARYFDNSGVRVTDPLKWFGETIGLNAMRVRLFVNPANAGDDDKGEGVCQDLPYVAALGKQIKDNGHQFVLDIHYSDTWADPGQQTLPAAWKGCTVAQLRDSVYQYTYDVLTTLVAAGATPDYIQTGNEITYGMLWPTGRIYPGGGAPDGGNWSYFRTYLNSAAKACREVCPDARIIIHVEMARAENPVNFFNNLANYNTDYDIIGLSYYAAYHGLPEVLDGVLTTLENDHPDRDIMIMETGYVSKWALPGTKNESALTAVYPYSEAGQQKFTADLIALLKKHDNVKGLFWWWPEANEYWVDYRDPVTSAWYNASLFDNSTGKALPALSTLSSFLDRE